MPVQTPTTFASAAASNGTGDGGTGRNTGGSVDWSRPRMNGSQTFRRPSQINTTGASQREVTTSAIQTPSSAVYVPPHMNLGFGRTGGGGSSVSAGPGSENRYNRDFMLDVFKAQLSDSNHKVSVHALLTEGWAPGQSAVTGGGGWGRRDESKDQNPTPDVCWDENGSTKPLGMIAMTEEERELFANSVNSTVKPPQPKDGAQTVGANGRKPSMSQGTGGLTNRPGTRRRDTSDSFGGNPLASPTFVRGARGDDNPLASPPPSLIRRRTDIKDGVTGVERPRLDTGGDTSSPFASLRRTTTNPLSAGVTGPASPWANEPPSAGGFGRMGSFGMLDQPATPGDKKPGFGSMRGESRFLKDLKGKDSSEDIAKGRDKLGPFGMDKVAEESSLGGRQQFRVAPRGEPGVIGEDPEARVGSAALGGEEHSSPPQHSLLSGSDRQQRRDDAAFSSFGGSVDLPPFRERLQQQQREGQVPGGTGGSFNEPMSPTDTNPYHSPDHERSGAGRRREEDEDSFAGLGPSKVGGNVGFDTSDHGSRPSSTAPPPRNMSGLGGFGGLSAGWPAAPGGMGPQAKSPLNDPFFGSLAEIGPSGGGSPFAPGGGLSGPGNYGSTRSKLGSLFPQSMQDQMRANEQRQDFFGSLNPASVPPRDTDSPAAQSSRNILDDIFGMQDRSKNAPSSQSPFPTSEGPFGHPVTQLQGQSFSTAVGTPAVQAPIHQAPGSFFGGPGLVSDTDSLPHAQQKTMVMPDRMRWIYRDPSGKTQGPFSGLEMHDWYKAGFFSPELQVKKLEDADYEPLAQLIRRIGNSREPFLVPQIGIAHGSVVGQSAGGIGANASGTVQPPFAGSFPSFGTTLTADQQNALERRKQEEQYLMAQQKEYLQHKQQMLMKNPVQFPISPFNVHPGQLHHHSSAHSLQSQPSFGSMGTPATGYPGAPIPVPQPGMHGGSFFDPQRPQHGPGPVGPMHHSMQPSRDEELASSYERMNIARSGQSPFNSMGPPMPPSLGHENNQNAVAAMLQQRQRLQQEQYDASQRGQVLPQDPSHGVDRLQEFARLRQGEEYGTAGVIGKSQAQHQHIELEQDPSHVEGTDEDEEERNEQEEEEEEEESELSEPEFDQQPMVAPRPEPISLPSRDITDVHTTEDVPPPQSVWAPIEKPVRQPIEPLLQASAVQRASKSVAEGLALEETSRSQTPSVETPSSSLAPWAKENVEAPRGPSLREIQEAEARDAAQAEAIAAEARRQLAEQERLAAASVPVAAPGLPSSASWAANSGSPVTPGGSAWAKPAASGKATGSTKKTLAQIQKEEEARKNKAAAAALAAAANSSIANTNVVAGKRYAELASKSPGPSGLAPNLPDGAWTTVGAGGKVKQPLGAVAAASRTVSGSIPTISTAALTAKKPAPPVRANTVQSAFQQANDGVTRWMIAALSKGLNEGYNAADLTRDMMLFPPDFELVRDTIYNASKTLDAPRLAEEFLRRRKLAERGISVTDATGGGATGASNAAGSANNGGWNEVAKKSAAPVVKDEPGAAFKVVSSKKKGGKR